LTGAPGRVDTHFSEETQVEEDEVQTYPMDEDRIVGDGGGVTIYERPDRSRYALDARGSGYELCFGEGAMGPARFDARALADGRWAGSRSRAEVPADRRGALLI
jgi:hypothetical protein